MKGIFWISQIRGTPIVAYEAAEPVGTEIPFEAEVGFHIRSRPVCDFQDGDFEENSGKDSHDEAVRQGINAGTAEREVPVVPNIDVHRLGRLGDQHDEVY